MNDEQEKTPEDVVPPSTDSSSELTDRHETPAEEPHVVPAESYPVAAEAETVPEMPAPAPPAPPENKKKWYVVKVQSGREDSIRNNLERRIKIEGLEEFITRILIPVEKITEVKNGKRIEKKRKKFPGYLMCEVEFNDRVTFLFRETSGVGDFVGGSLHKLPPPMTDEEVRRMLVDVDDVEGEGKKSKKEEKKDIIVLNFAVGDRVKVLQGMFKDSEGEVKEIPVNPAENSKVKVIVQFWGKPVDFEVDYWHVEPV